MDVEDDESSSVVEPPSVAGETLPVSKEPSAERKRKSSDHSEEASQPHIRKKVNAPLEKIKTNKGDGKKILTDSKLSSIKKPLDKSAKWT